ncbi:hypothetical protein TNIN_24101 [Trichonephila inaurata madagascariensis]|uniref:Uncharacterized protein n=1 Tax=Trichonephila inaurata madagascariensis TaxID=2747483 RepID=A0A8X6YCQ3_9ARAC|nr:hypothetical protein TNIN_24101 [Trichonephila inaurata madagascariensis]
MQIYREIGGGPSALNSDCPTAWTRRRLWKTRKSNRQSLSEGWGPSTDRCPFVIPFSFFLGYSGKEFLREICLRALFVSGRTPQKIDHHFLSI